MCLQLLNSSGVGELKKKLLLVYLIPPCLLALQLPCVLRLELCDLCRVQHI
jgi:hypothetical protein